MNMFFEVLVFVAPIPPLPSDDLRADCDWRQYPLLPLTPCTTPPWMCFTNWYVYKRSQDHFPSANCVWHILRVQQQCPFILFVRGDTEAWAWDWLRRRQRVHLQTGSQHRKCVNAEYIQSSCEQSTADRSIASCRTIISMLIEMVIFCALLDCCGKFLELSGNYYWNYTTPSN